MWQSKRKETSQHHESAEPVKSCENKITSEGAREHSTLDKLRTLLSDGDTVSRELQDYKAEIDALIPKWITKQRLSWVSEIEDRRISSILMEIEKHASSNDKTSSYLFGSAREGSILPYRSDQGTVAFGSDIDAMFVYCHLDIEEVDRMVCDITGFPGFVTVDLSTAPSQILDTVRDKTERVDDRLYLSARKIKQITMQDRDEGYSWETSKPDPSSSDKVASKHKSSSSYVWYSIETDYTLAVLCDGWPSIAKDWKNRKRAWPSEDVVGDIVSSRYHLVPKANLDAPVIPEIQWRLSFSLAEVALIDNLTGIRMLVFRIVKDIIKQNESMHEGSEALTTYHLKTALFWCCENTSEDLWTDLRLSECIRMILEWLLSACNEKEMPHYFVPQLNLLQSVTPENMDGMRQTLSWILEKLQITSRDDNTGSNLHVTAFSEILTAQRQARMSPVISSLFQDRYQLVFKRILARVIRRRTHFLSLLVNDAALACLYLSYFPDKEALVQQLAYAFICAHAAENTMAARCVSELERICGKWNELFGENDIVAYRLIEESIDWSVNTHDLGENMLEHLSDESDLELFLTQSVSIAEAVTMEYYAVLGQTLTTVITKAYQVSCTNSDTTDVGRDLTVFSFIPQEIAESMKEVFELPQEISLTIHDLADPDIWLQRLTMKDMLEKVNNEGNRKCNANNCFYDNVAACKKIRENKCAKGTIHFHKINCGKTHVTYANGDQIQLPSMMRAMMPNLSLQELFD